MKCPECGTNGIEGGVCFYCEARKERQKKREAAESADANQAAPPSPETSEPPPENAPPA